MRTAITAIIVTGFAVLAVMVLLFFLLRPTVSPQSPPTTTVPREGTGGGGNTSVVTVPEPQPTQPDSQEVGIPVLLRTGQTVIVKDFKSDPTTMTDDNNPGVYYIVGGLDPAGDNAPYSIFYNETDKSFSLTLLQEPLKEIRQIAEQELLQKLGITQLQACALSYWVSVPYWVSETHAGKNLGFGFCPGAVAL